MGATVSKRLRNSGFSFSPRNPIPGFERWDDLDLSVEFRRGTGFFDGIRGRAGTECMIQKVSPKDEISLKEKMRHKSKKTRI
jgi:hypothetical protein